MSPAAAWLACAGCGARPGAWEPHPFRCPAARAGDDVDHVLRRGLELGATVFPVADPEQNPFLRYRHLLYAYRLARAGGLGDRQFCALVRGLDDEVACLEGHGFAATPLVRSRELDEELGFVEPGGVWIKDETGNVSGSHKARHLFGVLVQLEVAERLGLADGLRRHDLAIASCGNAALAAAVLAAAARRTLHVFVPPDADPAVLARLRELDALVEVCGRAPGEHGDPTVSRLLEAVESGALPFTCQGHLNGLAVEGGYTLAYELASDLAAAGAALDRIVVQVGGGALASACSGGLQEAVALGALRRLPRLDTVQTAGAWPLRRAFERLAAWGDPAAALRYAARHRSEFMQPWPDEPHSVAHGILDDETYDWLAVAEGMLATGGRPLVVDDATLLEANDLAVGATGVPVDATGSAGLAGLLALRAAGLVDARERVAVLFTGVARSAPSHGRSDDEELSRTRHPVAEELRAG